MAKIAALEFDDQVARVVLARTTGNSFDLQSAFEIELDASFENDHEEFGQQLSAALGNRLGRCDALLSFGRGQSELRVIGVPKVPDDELPDIVRFQAMRQFTNSTDDSPVDFLTLGETAEEKQVLAATIPRAVLENLKSGCATAGLQLKGVKLRGSCSAALSRVVSSDYRNYIIINPASTSFNVEVVAFGNLCLTRTVRSVSVETGKEMQIVREIRRTLAAANNQISDYETSRVVVFGNESDFPGLKKLIEEDMQFDCDFIDPFSQTSGLDSVPENAGTYASLIGLLVDHVSKNTETIDFLNPRKKVVSKDGRNTKILIGAAAAVLFVGLALLGYLLLASQTNKINKINEQIKKLSKNHKTATEIIADVSKIEEFDNQQVIWLRSLANLSEDFPEPDFAILNNLTFTSKAGVDDGAKIEFSGYVNGIESQSAIENAVRNDIHNAVVDKTQLITDDERDQEYYSHKISGRVFHEPQVDPIEVPEEELEEFRKKHLVKVEKDQPDEKEGDEETKDKDGEVKP